MIYIVSAGIQWEGQWILFADISLNLIVDRINRMFENEETAGSLEHIDYLLFQVVKDGKPAYYYRAETNLDKVTCEEIMSRLKEEANDVDKGEF